jgi:CRP/FNR family transcriptional regulator, nitrogen oxide reductase regulator
VPRTPIPASPLLDGLSDDEHAKVVGAATARQVAGGAVLFHEGEPAVSLVLTASGRFKLTQVSEGGQEVVVRFSGPGDPFGALAVLDGKVYPFTATAVVPSRVLQWSRLALGTLFAHVPGFQRNVLSVVGGHGREMLDRVRELATEAVPRRLARALERLLPQGESQKEGVLLTDVTQQDLAHMSGTTLFTVSRTLAEWQRAGVVETGRGRVLVRNRNALAALARD